MLKKDFIRFAVGGLAMAVALNLTLFSIDISHYMSESDVFNRVAIGMPSAQAIDLLQEKQIWCDLRSSNFCRFSDFWHNYEIGLDPTRHIVSSKSSIPVRRDRVERAIFRF